MKTVALVACTSKKQDQPTRAAELYQSAWFHKAMAFAQRHADVWYILSARYGLLEPDTIIAPYDETLNNMTVEMRRVWAKKVLERLQDVLQAGDHVIILAGMRYREYLLIFLRQKECIVEVPLAGLRIGEQLQWLTQNLEV